MFENVKFGDKYAAVNGKTAVFLRFAENSENKFAFFYIEDWGTVQVFRNNGKEVHGDIEYSILPNVQVYQELDDAAEAFAHSYDNGTCDGIAQDCFKAGAKWDAEQGVTIDGEICIPYALQDRKKGAELVVRAKLSKGLGFRFGDKVIVQIRKKDE